MPISNAMGMVTATDEGRSVTVSCRMIDHGTPLAIICSARSMMKGIIRMNVKTSSAMKNGGRISRMMYRSRVRMACHHYRPW